MTAYPTSSLRFLQSLPILVMGSMGTSGLPQNIDGSGPLGSAVRRCERMLHFARLVGLPIAHAVTGSIKGRRAANVWRPLPTEMICELEQPSIYSCELLDLLLRNLRGPMMMMAGNLTADTIEASGRDAEKRGHRMLVVRDALISLATGADRITTLGRHVSDRITSTTTRALESWALSIREVEHQNAVGR